MKKLCRCSPDQDLLARMRYTVHAGRLLDKAMCATLKEFLLRGNVEGRACRGVCLSEAKRKT